MPSNTAQNNSHRQLLMRCQVTNPQRQTGQRFVDHAEYPMWRFLLEQKHGLTVADPAACVWVPRDECRRHDKLFSHAAYQADVLKLTFEKYSARTGITEKQVRFVLAEELDKVSALLKKHLAADTLVMDVQAGEAISTSPAKRWFKAHPAAAYCAA